MLRVISFCFLQLILFRSVSAQTIAQNINLIYNWDVDTLPHFGVTYSDIWGYTACDGREYAIIGSIQRIHFFDITDDNNIREIANFKTGSNSIWRDFKTYGTRVYAVADQGNEGLLIYDMSHTPDTIIQTNQINTVFQKTHNIYIDVTNGRLYVAGSNTHGNALIVFDLTEDPDHPILLGSVDLAVGGYVHDVFVRDNIAYCSHGNHGFFVWDFNDPTAPQVIASVATLGYNHSSWVTDNNQYAIYAEEVPRGIPLGIIDLKNMRNNDIEVIANFKEPLLAPTHLDNTPHNPFVRGNHVIVSYYEDGVVVFDISDIQNPQRVAYYDTNPNNTSYHGTASNWGVYPFFPSGKIVASDTDNGLFVFSTTLDLAPIIDPYTQIKITGDTAICEGDTTILSVPKFSEFSYQWFKDGQAINAANSAELVVNTSGNYQVFIGQNGCTKESSTINIHVDSIPDITIQTHNDLPPVICEGQGLELFVNTDLDSIEWTLNGEQTGFFENFIHADEAGIFGLLVYQNNCAFLVDEIEISSRPIPEVNIVADGATNFCNGQSVKLSTNIEANFYQWFLNGEDLQINNKEITATKKGTYQLVVFMDACQILSNTIEIETKENQQAVIAALGNTLSASHGQRFQWFLNGEAIPDATQQFFEAAESGVYYVVISYENGCSSTSNEIEISLTAVDDISFFKNIILFPNPSSNLLNIILPYLNNDAIDLQLYNSNGQLLFTQIINNNNTTIDLKDRLPGVYLLRLMNKDGAVIRKIVKN